MSVLTDHMIADSAGWLKPEPEMSDGRYTMFNGGSVEVEVAEFLYAMVRMLKPKFILETGTHKGVSAAYMAEALWDNTHTWDGEGGGYLHTIEFEKSHVFDAQQLINSLGLENYVEIAHMPVEEFHVGSTMYDLIFLDTEPQTRFAELARFEPYLNDGGYMLIHDLHAHMHQVPNEEHGFAWPYGVVTNDMRELVISRKLVVTHFENPRGMTMFYKPHQDTYVW